MFYFDGSIEEWPSFISQYDELQDCVHLPMKKIYLDCIQMFKRKCKRSSKMSHKNVNEIIDCLTLHFGKPEYIGMALIEKARKVPYVKE